MPLSNPQKKIFDSDTRFRVVASGRRFGKTYLSVTEMAYAARMPNKKVYYITATYRMAKQIAWEDLKEKMISKRWAAKINETDLSIILVNGSKITLRGSDNPDSLRGITADFIVLDEAAYCSKSLWEAVLRPTLSTTGGGALFITTPCGVNNWIYDLFQKGLDPNEEQWESFKFTTVEGGNVPEWEIEQAKRDLDKRTFEQEYLADFTTASNLVHYAFSREHNIKKFNDPIPNDIYIGMDFNVGQMSAVCFSRKGNLIHAFDEISLLSSNTFEIVEEIRTRYPGKRITIYPDPAGAARKSSSPSGITDHSILQNANFIVKTPRSHNLVRDGINAVNSKLCAADGTRTYLIDPKCKKTIESLEKHSYKEGSNIPDKDSGFDHFSDAPRYFIDYEFPVKRNIEMPLPERFGHRLA